jgi:hypothetical protein
MRRMRACITVLVLSLIVGFSSGNSQQIGAVHNGKPNAVTDKALKPVDCADPNGYSVESGTEPGTNSVKILSSGTVLHTIELPTGESLNGFAFDGVKKTSQGFEISIEYGSVIYYHKAFVFICRRHKFYLSKIKVDSFNKHNPEKWSKKVIRVRPSVPLGKFFITDYMNEGVVK